MSEEGGLLNSVIRVNELTAHFLSPRFVGAIRRA